MDRKDDEAAVTKGLAELQHHAKTIPNFYLPQAGKRVLLHILQTFRKSGGGSGGGSGGAGGGGGGGGADIPAGCCAVLAATLMTEEETDPLMSSAEMIKAVTDAMRAHVGNQVLYYIYPKALIQRRSSKGSHPF